RRIINVVQVAAVVIALVAVFIIVRPSLPDIHWPLPLILALATPLLLTPVAVYLSLTEDQRRHATPRLHPAAGRDGISPRGDGRGGRRRELACGGRSAVLELDPPAVLCASGAGLLQRRHARRVSAAGHRGGGRVDARHRAGHRHLRLPPRASGAPR